jgi:hypothetical protein
MVQALRREVAILGDGHAAALPERARHTWANARHAKGAAERAGLAVPSRLEQRSDPG